MDVIFEQYQERLHRLRRHPDTITGFTRAAGSLGEYLKARQLAAPEVKLYDLEEYFATLSLAPSTKKLYLSHIGAAYRYALRRGLVPEDPTVDVLLERTPDKEPRIIPTAELKAMKGRLVEDLEWLLWHLLVYTGMRRREIVSLEWENVKLGDGTITVLGKGGKLRHVPIHPALAEVLVEDGDRAGRWVLTGRRIGGEDRPISLNAFHMAVDRMTRRQFTAHDFRRTVASSLYANGVEGDTIDKILGWAPRVVRTRYYVNVAPEQLQRAILKLYSEDPI